MTKNKKELPVSSLEDVPETWSNEDKTGFIVEAFFDILAGYDEAISKMNYLISKEPTKHLRTFYKIVREGMEEDRETTRKAYELMCVEGE